MRESQQAIFYGPLGSTILQHDDSPPSPTRRINLEVAAWRAGHRPYNPQSILDGLSLQSHFQQSALLNETSNNEYRADHPPEPAYRRYRHARSNRYQFVEIVPANAGGVSTTNPDYVTPVIYRRQRRQYVASPGVLEFDTSRVSDNADAI